MKPNIFLVKRSAQKTIDNEERERIMEKLEKVQQVIENTGVGFGEAKEALEACNYDVLDAIVALEREGKVKGSAQTQTQTSTEPCPSTDEDQTTAADRGKRFTETWERLMDSVRRVCRWGLDASFVAQKSGRTVFTMPVLLFGVLLLFAFWICVPLLVVGLFFDFHYRFEGVGPVSLDVNGIAEKASEAAQAVKSGVGGGESK